MLPYNRYLKHLRVLLDVAKERWEGKTMPYRSGIEHISVMQDRIVAVMPLVREHMEKALLAQRRVYKSGCQDPNL